jgi:hypothetical protein
MTPRMDMDSGQPGILEYGTGSIQLQEGPPGLDKGNREIDRRIIIACQRVKILRKQDQGVVKRILNLNPA